LFFFFLFCISAALASFLCLCPRRSRRLNLLAHPLVLSVSLSVCVCVRVWISSPHLTSIGYPPIRTCLHLTSLFFACACISVNGLTISAPV
jgi:hypothetical protein